MKVQKTFFALAVFFVLSMTVSCEKEDIGELETISVGDDRAIDGNEIQDEDM